jgi:hypothetical protein
MGDGITLPQTIYGNQMFSVCPPRALSLGATVCKISEGFSVWALKRKRLETTRHQHIIKTARQAGVDPEETLTAPTSASGIRPFSVIRPSKTTVRSAAVPDVMVGAA